MPYVRLQYLCMFEVQALPTTHRGRSKAEANTARGVKNVSISAWFYALVETLDIMPDKAIQEWHQTLEQDQETSWTKQTAKQNNQTKNESIVKCVQ